MLLAAAVVWPLVGIAHATTGRSAAAADAARHTLLDFAELLLFLIPAMTFVNTLEERGLFDVVRGWLMRQHLSARAIFWLTGGLAFVVSPIADNLTTALLLGGIVLGGWPWQPAGFFQPQTTGVAPVRRPTPGLQLGLASGPGQ